MRVEKKRRHAPGVLVLALLWPCLGLAADYYVSPAANDAAPGTLAAPWRHLAYANCGGTYPCPVTNDNPKRLKAGEALAQIASHFNVHYSTVSRALGRRAT